MSIPGARRRCLEIARLPRLAVVLGWVALSLQPAVAFGQETEEWAELQVISGTASFDASTNVPAINVHGTSTELAGRVRLRRDPGGLLLRDVEATVPVLSLTTGMSMRDKHMRAHVFTTPEGEIPDLRFTAGEAACTAGKREEHTCVLTGELTIRRTARPFAVTVRLSRDNGAVRAVADGAVQLSAYGIDRPSQLGVVAEDEVRLHLILVSTPLAKGSRLALRSAAAR
jgi:polyisoprenoid-binding protein YceI